VEGRHPGGAAEHGDRPRLSLTIAGEQTDFPKADGKVC
jgi:hypothetical protein